MNANGNLFSHPGLSHLLLSVSFVGFNVIKISRAKSLYGALFHHVMTLFNCCAVFNAIPVLY